MDSLLIRIDIITAIPEMFDSILKSSMIKIGLEKGKAEIIVHDLHKFADNTFGHIDDYPYGGGAGMLIKCQPFFDCIEKLLSERSYDEIIFMSAEGEKLNQKTANELSLKQNIMILCGHYKGIDQRIRDRFVTKEISAGDFILSGGEIPAMMLTDAIVRLLPGVLGDIESALEDSYMDGLLEAPQYTRPAVYNDLPVPEILLNGHHLKIKEWQLEQSIEKTKLIRPDLFQKYIEDNY